MGTRTKGHVKIIDASCYPNLAAAEGKVVACVIEKFPVADTLYHILPEEFVALGCDVGTCQCAYPFYANEVTEE